MNWYLDLKSVPRPSKIQNSNAHTNYHINHNAIPVFQFFVCDRINSVNLIHLVMVVNHFSQLRGLFEGMYYYIR